MMTSQTNPDQASGAIVDSDARIAAINTRRSCCVTAPAGSGKTELLTQRFLALLAEVDQPEQVLALTFTRKAAAEMRERIISALQKVHEGEKPASSHQAFTFGLARNALRHSERQDWNLLQYPMRLKIQTLDSLCHAIVREQPLFSGAGGRLQATDDAEPLYLQAIDIYLAELGDSRESGNALRTLLLFCDNNVEQLKSLFLKMLPFRDQWLDHASDFQSASDRESLLARVLQKRINQALSSAHSCLQQYERQITESVSFAAGNFLSGLCEQDEKAAAVASLHNLKTLPEPQQSGFLQWQGIVQLLLKEDRQPRKTLNRNQGFPAQNSFSTAAEKENAKLFKQQLLDVCNALAKDNETLDALQTVAMLPLAGYERDQLALLDCMVQVLIRLVAHLNLVFQQRGECDHLEISSAALRALNGQSAYPDVEPDSGIAYRWSQKFRHVLVDEFQDTSVSQYELLQSLTSDWSYFNIENEIQPKTLFLVGDGMQSIYSFRAAKVGLFIRSRESGIGELQLDNLVLQQNFRSCAGIIDWVNRHFGPAFPARSEVNRGAVPYSPSVATQSLQNDTPDQDDTSVDNTVTCRWFVDDETEGAAEAEYIAERIIREKEKNPDIEIAVLVRARSHLDRLLPVMQSREIAWEGVDIDPLSTRESIMDCLTLTAALLNPVDDMAWYSLLRSPLCGLRLRDLQWISDRIANSTELISVPDILLDPALIESAVLSDISETRRLQAFCSKLRQVFKERGANALRLWLENAWITLQGETIARNAYSGDESAAVQDFLSLVETLDQQAANRGEVIQFEQIRSAVDKLYATASIQNQGHENTGRGTPVRVMTIHKSKGLEFDMVFLPALQKSTAANKKPLLISHDYLFEDGSSGLLLYPKDRRAMLEADNRKPPRSLFEHLLQERNRAQSLESTRLFYVAATRAKQKLVLTACLRSDEKTREIKPPTKNSMLSKLWGTLHPGNPTSAEVMYVNNEQDSTATPGKGIAASEVHLAGNILKNYADNAGLDSTALLKRLSDEAIMTRSLACGKDASSLTEELSHNEIHNGVLDQSAGHSAEQNEVESLSSIATGICCHELLQLTADSGFEFWNSADLASLRECWIQRLYDLGVPADELANEIGKVERTIDSIINTPNGRWLFSAEHRQAHSEWRLLNTEKADTQNNSGLSVIDRSFIDSEGTRWIIDYKISEPMQGEDVKQFANRQLALYADQLQRYSDLVINYDSGRGESTRETRCGLYFPLIDHLELVNA